MDNLNLDQRKETVLNLLLHQIDTPLAAVTEDKSGNMSAMDPKFTQAEYDILSSDIRESNDIQINCVTKADENSEFKKVAEIFKQEGYDLSKYKYIAAIRRPHTHDSRSKNPDVVFVLLG